MLILILPEFLPDAVADALLPLVWWLFRYVGVIANAEAIVVAFLLLVLLIFLPDLLALRRLRRYTNRYTTTRKH